MLDLMILVEEFFIFLNLAKKYREWSHYPKNLQLVTFSKYSLTGRRKINLYQKYSICMTKYFSNNLLSMTFDGRENFYFVFLFSLSDYMNTFTLWERKSTYLISHLSMTNHFVCCSPQSNYISYGVKNS